MNKIQGTCRFRWLTVQWLPKLRNLTLVLSNTRSTRTNAACLCLAQRNTPAQFVYCTTYEVTRAVYAERLASFAYAKLKHD